MKAPIDSRIKPADLGAQHQGFGLRERQGRGRGLILPRRKPPSGAAQNLPSALDPRAVLAVDPRGGTFIQLGQKPGKPLCRNPRIRLGGSELCRGRIQDGPGLLMLVGVTHTDDEAIARRLAQKAYDLRIFDGARFPTAEGSREVSASDLGLPVLVVSQFTLYADTRKGRRPTWDAAAPGPVAEPLVDVVADELGARGAKVATGRFGADMRVHLVNDGPVTIPLQIKNQA